MRNGGTTLGNRTCVRAVAINDAAGSFRSIYLGITINTQVDWMFDSRPKYGSDTLLPILTREIVCWSCVDTGLMSSLAFLCHAESHSVLVFVLISIMFSC